MSLRGSSRKSRTILTQKKDLMKETNMENTNQTKGENTETVRKVAKYKKPAYLNSLNEAEKSENFKIIDNMNKRINFLRNPRYKTNKAPITLNKVCCMLILYKFIASHWVDRRRCKSIFCRAKVYTFCGLPN